LPAIGAAAVLAARALLPPILLGEFIDKAITILAISHRTSVAERMDRTIEIGTP
jgi:hypothetical protein